MSRNNVIVIVVAIVLIITCLVIGNKKRNTNISDNKNRDIKNVSYNVVTNEVTGKDEYIVYDKETGTEKTRVDGEYQLKIYELDPDYEELPVDSSHDEITMENSLENYE